MLHTVTPIRASDAIVSTERRSLRKRDLESCCAKWYTHMCFWTNEGSTHEQAANFRCISALEQSLASKLYQGLLLTAALTIATKRIECTFKLVITCRHTFAQLVRNETSDDRAGYDESMPFRRARYSAVFGIALRRDVPDLHLEIVTIASFCVQDAIVVLKFIDISPNPESMRSSLRPTNECW